MNLLRKRYTDQGSQFTSIEFINRLLLDGIQISLDDRGRALDNVFVERFWRSLKYENIYPNCVNYFSYSSPYKDAPHLNSLHNPDIIPGSFPYTKEL